ncbi:MAG: 16S rRNA (uracil(1498)-N(3))-methyltransferase [Bacteroidales bacterium]|nr:16S rRNA (uracil(1498)-N(3))-methyltransferase [Bacteroidales bacterium]
MQIFYCQTDINAKRVFLDSTESHHCIKVLRLKQGDEIFVIDGKGGFAKAEIVSDNYKSCEIKILEIQQNFKHRNYYLHIGIAPTKNIDRIEWFVEKAVEFGIDEISFLLCQRSERKNINIERIEKIALAATKQSIKAYLPKINPLTKFNEFVDKNLEQNRYIAHCGDEFKEHFANIMPVNENILVLLGPEGDFTYDEIDIAKSKGFVPISLGNSRLRTETAGIAVCSIVSLKNETA